MWSLRERSRAAVRQQAQETAANILEAARAYPWEALNADWAAAQKLPDDLAAALAGGTLTVRIDTVASQPHLKQVSVEIREQPGSASPMPPVELIGLFSARSAAVAGGAP